MGLILVIGINLFIYIKSLRFIYKKLSEKIALNGITKSTGIVIYLLASIVLIPVAVVIPLVGVFIIFKLDFGANFGPGATVLVMPVLLDILVLIVSSIVGVKGLLTSTSKSRRPLNAAVNFTR